MPHWEIYGICMTVWGQKSGPVYVDHDRECLEKVWWYALIVDKKVAIWDGKYCVPI